MTTSSRRPPEADRASRFQGSRFQSRLETWAAGKPARFYLLYRLGLLAAATQLNAGERDCLSRHAADRRALVEIGVLHGASTALLRRAMHPEGTITGIDPHPTGRLGVSFERAVARRELAKVRRGSAVLLRRLSHEAAAAWTGPIDFLFIDGDHSWQGIERDWTAWSGRIAMGGVVALHDSRSVPGQPDHDSVRYAREVILADPRFREIDAVSGLTVLLRVADRTGEPL